MTAGGRCTYRYTSVSVDVSSDAQCVCAYTYDDSNWKRCHLLARVSMLATCKFMN